MKTIVVGYEQRTVAPRVLERAAEWAKLLRAKVIVTSVAPVLSGRGGGIDPLDTPSHHVAETAYAAAQLREFGVDHVEERPGIGDPADAILRIANHEHATLIVVGAHEGGVLTRLFGGSPGDDVVHRATTDVLIVH